jgi:hypothetical protein
MGVAHPSPNCSDHLKDSAIRDRRVSEPHSSRDRVRLLIVARADESCATKPPAACTSTRATRNGDKGVARTAGEWAIVFVGNAIVSTDPRGRLLSRRGSRGSAGGELTKQSSTTSFGTGSKNQSVCETAIGPTLQVCRFTGMTCTR